MKVFLSGVFFLCLMLPGMLRAQSAGDAQIPLQSAGTFPTEFIDIMQQKPNSKDFNGFLYELIKEGRVLYGTPLNEYVGHIADNLLKDYPQLRSELRFYILKSSDVNAFSTEQGVILVNMGLLAQVSNEAELAFAVAHEIAHYAEHHKRENYDDKKHSSYMSYYLTYQIRSREQEAAADRVAVERYISTSSYSYKALDGLFDVLQYGDLPFDEIPFDRAEVETSFYQFPDNCFLKKVSPIANRWETIDTLYSHPNMDKRRSLVKSMIAGKSDDGRSLFVQSREAFDNMRNLARMECIYYWLGIHQYDQAIYNAYVMHKSQPDNAFLDRAMATAYYGMFIHKRNGSISDVVHPYKKVEGEMQQVSYFLSQLSRVELSLLSLRYAWKAHEKYPEDPCFSDLIKESMREIFVVNKKKYTDFSDYPMGYVADSTATAGEAQQQPDNAQTGSKYDKIKQGSQNYDMVVPTSKFRTANYMLVDIHRDSNFVVLMNEVMLEEDNKQILNAITSKTEKVKTMLLMEPYCEVKTKTYHPDNERKEEKIQKQLSRVFLQSAKRLKLQTVYFDVNTIKSFDTKQYNDYVTLCQWYREYGYAGGAQMKYLASDELKRITQELKCDKMCMVAASREHARFVSGNKIIDLVFSVTCPYTIPFSLANFALPRYNTQVSMMIVDINTGKQERFESQSYTSPMSRSYRNAAVYDELYNYVKGRK